MRRLALALGLLLLTAGLAGARLAPEDAGALGTRQPVVLIHGWNADAAVWNRLARMAAEQPVFGRRCQLYRFEYDWRRPVRASAEQFSADLAGRPELVGRPVVLVGHSMGGLVARELAESGADALARVAAVYTLGTPHHGTPAANLGWLAQSSKYSGWLNIVPNGLTDLVGRIDIFRALRTEGGRDLGWDNYDGLMPPEIWVGEGRWLAEANRRFSLHPAREEWLRRYRLLASYLPTVGELGLWRTSAQLRGGREFEAGAALLAHGLRGASGAAISAYTVSDGIVPLDSALWLKPGAPLTLNAVDAVAQARLERPELVTLIARGLDHSALITEASVVRRLLEQLAGEDSNLLALDLGGKVGLWRAGWKAPRQVADGTLLGARADRLVVAAPDGLRLMRPGDQRLVAPGVGDWSVGPTASVAASAAEGHLLGLDRPWLVRGSGALSDPLWSPDGARLAARRDGRVIVVEVESGRVETHGEGWAVAWRGDGRALLIADRAGCRAVWLAAGQRVLASPSESRYSVVGAGDVTVEPVAAVDLAATASDVAWLPSGAPRELRLRALGGDAARSVALPVDGAALAALPDGRLALLGHDGEQSRLLLIDPRDGGQTVVASTRWRVRGPLTVSPDGRYVAAIWPDNEVWTAATDGGDSVWLPGRAPRWLPLPGWRGFG